MPHRNCPAPVRRPRTGSGGARACGKADQAIIVIPALRDGLSPQGGLRPGRSVSAGSTPCPHSIYQHPLARFERPVAYRRCSRLRGDLADEIAGRIRANAERLKVKLAGPHCSPNLLVVFVDDGQSYLGKLERKYPRLFSLVDEAERSELLAGGDRCGCGAMSPRARWSAHRSTARERQMGRPDQQGPKSVMLPSRTDIDSAAGGVRPRGRGGDERHAARRLCDDARARPHPPGERRARRSRNDPRPVRPDDSRSPDELTSFDIGYLKSLYWWEANVPAVDKLLGVQQAGDERRARASPPS